VRAPGRTPEAVLSRTTSRRAAIAVGAALLFATSASSIPATTQPATAAPPAPAPSGSYLLAHPALFTARAEHVASRGSIRPAPRAHRAVRVHPPARTRPRTRAGHRAEHRTVRHRAARAVAGGTGRLGVAFAYAAAQIGDPYVYGAARPGAWDCSGLTSAAYERIGIPLPHRAAEQARRGVAIPRSQARVGDLVVWGSHHVGLYAGHGRVLHAPRPGKRVQIAPIWGSPTYRRVTRG
jgi:cell wall-associated NlpC family hydrolase